MTSLDDFLYPSQKKLFKRLCKKFKGNTLISKGNVILVGGQAPVMLVAHLDTVHSQRVHDICKSNDGNILMSPQGIGGDDRCGVFALVQAYHAAQIKPWLLFCCDEEVGGLGAKKFCLAHQQHQLPKELDQLKFLIEIDRKGSNDAVYYNCANSDFEEYITSKGFKSAQGSFSDISLIAPELGIAAVNLSSGYYHAHSLHEFINRSELNFTIQKIIEIVSDSVNNDFPKFEYVESCGSLYYSQKNRPYDNLTILYNKQDDIPRRISSELKGIYEALLDFYSVNELESFRAEYGDQILWQIYKDEIASFY